MKISSPKVIN
jgi:hypothetical protein